MDLNWQHQKETMAGWRTFKFSPPKVTQQHEEIQCPSSLMSLPPNQTILFKNECFFCQCAAWYWHTGPFCHWSQPSAQQLSDPTWNELSSFTSQGCVNSKMTDNGSQATSQNTALDRWWENSRETRMRSRGIFFCGQGLSTLYYFRRGP